MALVHMSYEVQQEMICLAVCTRTSQYNLYVVIYIGHCFMVVVGSQS